MTGVIKVNELQGRSTTDNITVTDGNTTFSMQSGLNKMWISYDGIANSIFSSLNISSVTDNATGDYIYLYTNNFNAAEEYSSAMSVALQSSAYPGSYVHDNNTLTSQIKVMPQRSTSSANIDIGYTTMNCCGDLA